MHDAGDRNHRIILRAYGPRLTAFGPENLGADTTAVPTPGPGQFLSRTLYLSLDPLYRAAMQGNGDASLRLNPGDVIGGETAAPALPAPHPENPPGGYTLVGHRGRQLSRSCGPGGRRAAPPAATC